MKAGCVTDGNLGEIGRLEQVELRTIFGTKLKFKLEPVLKTQYGEFYTGDAYVCLHSKNRDEWHIHFWIGEEATTDEMGTAAITTVEIDQALNGLPVQHREIQNHESPLFLSYFPNGIRLSIGTV
uniref:Gelsolin-like domain-containing protein n=1 Tax=Angiostrongylus cantonensis TaxID=6313 RepID=A0A0K0D2Y6_ANGCA